MRISFTISSLPVAQPRHKVAVIKDGEGKAAGVRHFIDGTHPVHQFKYVVRVEAEKAMREAGASPPQDCPIGLVLKFRVPRPTWVDATIGRGKMKLPKWGLGEVFCWKVPDLDNLEKAVKDACKGVLWYDDRQVAMVQKMKVHHAIGESAGLDVEVFTLEPTATNGEESKEAIELWEEDLR